MQPINRSEQFRRGEQFADGETSTLCVMAFLNDDAVARYKAGEQHWVKLVDGMRNRLKTNLAKDVASYLLYEKTERPLQGTHDENAAHQVAQTMMLSKRQGYAEKFPATSSTGQRSR